MAIKRKVQDGHRPMPLARMIRLTAAVYWNHIKGGVDIICRYLKTPAHPVYWNHIESGVDVICRYLKTLARCNFSEYPVVTIVPHLLMMKVSNPAVIYRLNHARKSGALPEIRAKSCKKGYFYYRHAVTSEETFWTICTSPCTRMDRKYHTTR